MLRVDEGGGFLHLLRSYRKHRAHLRVDKGGARGAARVGEALQRLTVRVAVFHRVRVIVRHLPRERK